MMILSIPRSTCSGIRTSSSARCSWESKRSAKVSATPRGCSWISFSMKVGHPPLVARSAEKSTSYSLRGTGCPSAPITVTAEALTTTSWSCPISTARFVCSINASTSEPRKFSPSPKPITSGDDLRAATMTLGDSVDSASSVKVPSSFAVTSRMATTSRRATASSVPLSCATSPVYEAGSAWS